MTDIILHHNAAFLGRNGKLLRSRPVPPVINICDNYQGGVVVYLFLPGDSRYVEGETHGIISPTSDISGDYTWWNGSNILCGASYIERGYGGENTEAIHNAQGFGTYAAERCWAAGINGYYDWVLPTRLDMIAIHTLSVNNGCLDRFLGTYWTSSEDSLTNALAFLWAANPDDDQELSRAKSNTGKVRPVRYF